jgi:hypothetical protein
MRGETAPFLLRFGSIHCEGDILSALTRSSPEERLGHLEAGARLDAQAAFYEAGQLRRDKARLISGA